MRQTIEDLEELYLGRGIEARLLFNGPSLQGHWMTWTPPGYRGAPVYVGMNRTFLGNPDWHGPDPHYLVVCDPRRPTNPHVAKHPGLINGAASGPDVGIRIGRSTEDTPFSFDLIRGYVGPTTGFVALQVAVWMGFKEIHCHGLDLKGTHFDWRGDVRQDDMEAQADMTREAIPLLRDRGVTLHYHGLWRP